MVECALMDDTLMDRVIVKNFEKKARTHWT